MSNEAERLREVIRLDSQLASVQDRDILLESILTEARKLSNADGGTIYIRERIRDKDFLKFSFTQNATLQKALPRGQKPPYLSGEFEINTKSIAGYVATTGELLNIPDVYRIRKEAPYKFNSSYDQSNNYKTTSMLTVPLKSNTILGVLQIINKTTERGEVVPFEAEDDILCQHFASAASLALQRAQLTRALLLRMNAMAELRDPKETGAHVNRVAWYAIEIYEKWAHKRGVPKEEIDKNRDTLRMAAMLHDVGKVAISDTILKKPGLLTKKERETMQRHTHRGAILFLDKQSAPDEIAFQSDLDKIAFEVALRHHENWDGTGYPGKVDVRTGDPLEADDNGVPVALEREEIPLYGRVVALADVYDALMSKRTYKEAWSEDDVLAEIKKLSGKKFDPELVEAFFDCLDVLRSVMKRYPDAE